jgi:hypothetical protein
MYSTTSWVNRQVEFPFRYDKSGETANVVTLTPSPGTVTEIGTPISSSNLNKIEEGIFNAQLLLYMGGM